MYVYILYLTFVYHSKDFSPEEPCSAVHLEKHRYALMKCEENFYLGLVVKNPTIVTRTKDGKTPSVEYLEDELEDSVLQAIIRRCYHLFKVLFCSHLSFYIYIHVISLILCFDMFYHITSLYFLWYL